jgi:hypothetical protein|tara:strand:- start:608 stop:1018 length:411 start_codon:yes stop_codon:yes gene_type:complete
MRFKTLVGVERTVTKSKKYLIDWSGSSRSKFQKSTKTFLKKYWEKHVVFEEFPIVGTRLSIDFYNANKKIAIEVQGRQHTQYVPFFHSKNKINYINQLKRDADKLEFCKINNIKLIEIYESDTINEELFIKFGVDL